MIATLSRQEIQHSGRYEVSRAYCNDRYRRAMRGVFFVCSMRDVFVCS